MITIKVLNAKGQTIAVAHGQKEVVLPLMHEYEEGDFIAFEIDKANAYYCLQPDDALGETMIYAVGTVYFHIPQQEKKICYSPKAFQGNRHLLTARPAEAWEILAYQNLSKNPMDQNVETEVHAYPHAHANVETRGEAVFAARNAIDGVKANHSHGEWPYGSWGINRNPEAVIRVDFGRKIVTDRIRIRLRADFPHDNWWKEVTVRFSDESLLACPLVKTDESQEILIPEKEITWIQLEKLIKADDPSPFPALTQIEVFGKNVIE